MDLFLKGKKAIVTGASEGLGFSCARMLAAEGVDVVIASRNLDKIEISAQSIRDEFSVQALAVQADISQHNDRISLVQKAKQAFENIDILVVSTGHPPTHPFSQATDSQWREGYDLILEPARHLPQMLINDMTRNHFGRIIFIGSIFGLEAEKSSVIQSTFRTGLNALSKCIATEYAAMGVTSNVICPGYYDTPLVQRLAGQYAEQEKTTTANILEAWKTFSPAQSYGKPDDLGAYVAFLASPRAAFITGQSHVLDGGALHHY